jgi:tetratricopeptide (TPR) repeat protein
MHPDRPSPYPPPTDVAGDPVADALLDDALDDALAQGDLITASRVAFEQSVRFHRIEEFRVAIMYGDLAIDKWRLFFHDRPSHEDPSVRFTELRMLNASAAQHFNRGHFDMAAERVQDARRLATLLPGVSLIASTEWNTALLERWRRDSPKALDHAERAFAIYRSDSDPMSIARLSQFIAQLALDCAAMSFARGAPQQATSYLAKARAYLEDSRPPSADYHTSAVDASFRVIYAIYSRLTGKNEDRVGLLESVARHAHNMAHPALEGLAYTTLGDEYASHDGMSDDARTCYATAFRLLLSSSAPAYTVWPLRALKQDWEYNLAVGVGAHY